MLNSVRSSRIASYLGVVVAIYLGFLVLLLIALSEMEAGADDGQAISTISTSSVASLQVVRVLGPIGRRLAGALDFGVLRR